MRLRSPLSPRSAPPRPAPGSPEQLRREAVIRGVVEFREAAAEVLRAEEWEWGLFTLSEAVRLYAGVGAGVSPPYPALLARAFAHVCDLVAERLNAEDPAGSIAAQVELRRLAHEMRLHPAVGPELHGLASALRGLAEETTDRHLRLLCAWACFAHVEKPQQEDVSLLLIAVRDCRLQTLEDTLRKYLGRQLLRGTRMRAAPVPEGEARAEAVPAVRSHAHRVPPLIPYAESLVFAINGRADNGLCMVLARGHPAEGGSVHSHILAWVEIEERLAARAALSTMPPPAPVSSRKPGTARFRRF